MKIKRGPVPPRLKAMRPHPPFEDLEGLDRAQIMAKFKAGFATAERWLGELELHRSRTKK